MNRDAAPVCLDAEDAIELGELLEFVAGWLDQAPDVLAEVQAGLCGQGYCLEDLQADLTRFAVVLGGDGSRAVSGDDL